MGAATQTGELWYDGQENHTAWATYLVCYSNQSLLCYVLGLGILACLLSKANSQDIKYPTQTNVDTANNKNSTEITNPIYEAIDPGTRSTAAITAQTSDDTLRIAAIEAVTAYTAENAKTGIDRSDAKIRVAKIKADAACRGLRNGGFDDIICLGF